MMEESEVNTGNDKIEEIQIIPHTEAETIFEYVAYKVCEVFCTTGVIDQCSQKLFQAVLVDEVKKEPLPKKTELLLSVATICGLLVDLKEGKLYPSLVTSCMPIFQYFLEEMECSKDLMMALLRLISLEGQCEGHGDIEGGNMEESIEQQSLEEVEDQMSDFVKMVLDKIGKPMISRIVSRMNFYESVLRNDLVATQDQRTAQPVDDDDSESESMEVEASKEEMIIGQDLQETATDVKQKSGQSLNFIEQDGSYQRKETTQAREKERSCTGQELENPNVCEDDGSNVRMRGAENEKDSNILQDIEGHEVEQCDAITLQNIQRHLDQSSNVRRRSNCGDRQLTQCELEDSDAASDEESMMESTDDEEELYDDDALYEEGNASLQSSWGLSSTAQCVSGRREASTRSDTCQQNSVSSSQDDRRRSSKVLRERKNDPDDVSDVTSSSGELVRAQVVTSGQGADPGGQTLGWSSEDEDVSETNNSVALNMSPTRQQGKKRRAWSYREIRNLRHGVQRYGAGRWSVIRSSYDFDDRTAVDLKDKWRNLNK